MVDEIITASSTGIIVGVVGATSSNGMVIMAEVVADSRVIGIWPEATEASSVAGKIIAEACPGFTELNAGATSFVGLSVKAVIGTCSEA